MNEQPTRVAVLGSTGSIGRQTLEVIRALPGRFRVVALAGGRNIDLLTEQVREFQPDVVGGALMRLEDIAARPDVDIVVMAVSGGAGLAPTLAAARAGKRIALANKESLVAAGEIIMAEAAKSGAAILPVDSEHSAIWQCLNGERDARRIILTASGGPFRSYTKAQMEKVTVAEALNHPSWRMGNKVTVDSATLMNKGLEIIEAHRLFGMAVEDIEVVIHPQSVIHSMVEFADGSLKAQLSRPDMRFPIQYALTYPARLPNPDLPKIDWAALGSLTFEAPDYDRFPCLRLAITAAKEGGTCPAVLAAADEAAVVLFLEERIGFTDIAAYVEKVLEKHQRITNPSLEEINAADAWARRTLNELAGVS